MTLRYNFMALGGNITRDPETRFTKSGTPVVSFTLAVDHGYGENKGTTFIDCTMFGKCAEAFAKYHSKGSGAFVTGELRQESWETKAGEKRSKLCMTASEWSFNGSAKGADTESTEPAEPSPDTEELPF